MRFNTFMISFGGILAVSAVMSQATFAKSVLDELKPEDQDKVKNGMQVTVTAPGDHSPWPQIWVYQRVDATPEETMAVFADYDRQQEYMLDLLYSKISKRIDKTTVEVGYTVATHVFLHPKENYTVRDHIETYDGGASYQMDWKFVSANQIRDIVGMARFESLGTGTVIGYYSFITPPSIAGGQANKAIQGVQAAVQRLTERVQTLRSQNQALLTEELAALRSALATY